MARKKQPRRQRKADTRKEEAREEPTPGLLTAEDPPPEGGEKHQDDARVHQGALFGQVETYSGPLPPPEILERYDIVVPGMAQALLDGYVAQGDHRREVEKKVVEQQLQQANRGQWMAFGLGALAIGLAGIAIILGREIYGLVALVASLGTFLTIFRTGKQAQARDLEEKRD